MDNSRKTGDIIGNSFGNNTNLQGDNVIQSNTSLSNEFSDAHANLLENILMINDQSQKEQALFIAEQLKVAYENGKKDQVKTPLKLLKGILGDVGSLASIASICGVTI